MMRKILWAALALMTVADGLSATRAHAVAFVDPLDTAATPDMLAEHEPLIAIQHAGSRLVAAGLRGLIIYSDDHGASWKQASVPVQSDLGALFFLDSKTGWASGQSGVILHTTDGGASWTKQFDGRGDTTLLDVYQKRLDQGDATVKPFVDTLKLNTANGPDLPYLDVLFENDHDGYAVGPYGMLIVSHDGGAHWEPWLDHIDNTQALNLNALAEIDGTIYIAGEQGKVYRLDRARGHFMTFDTGYTGSLFGITGTAKGLVTYGMLGHVLRSTDQGAHWQPVQTSLGASISGGTMMSDDRVLLATQAGLLLSGSLADGAFSPIVMKDALPLAGLVSDGSSNVAIVGIGGVGVRPLP